MSKTCDPKTYFLKPQNILEHHLEQKNCNAKRTALSKLYRGLDGSFNAITIDISPPSRSAKTPVTGPMSGIVSRKVTGTGEVATWRTAVAYRVGAEMHACYWLVVSADMDIKRGLVVKFASGLTTFAVDMGTEEREWKEFLFAVRGNMAVEIRLGGKAVAGSTKIAIEPLADKPAICNILVYCHLGDI